MPLEVELVSPERTLFSGEANWVRARTVGGGDIAFLPGHAPFVGALATWTVEISLALAPAPEEPVAELERQADHAVAEALVAAVVALHDEAAPRQGRHACLELVRGQCSERWRARELGPALLVARSARQRVHQARETSAERRDALLDPHRIRHPAADAAAQLVVVAARRLAQLAAPEAVQLDQVRASAPREPVPEREARGRARTVHVSVAAAGRAPTTAPAGEIVSVLHAPTDASSCDESMISYEYPCSVRNSWRFCANSWSREPSVTTA
jgi:hypothetical protein